MTTSSPGIPRSIAIACAAAGLLLGEVAWGTALKYHLAALAGFDPLLHKAAWDRTVRALARIWQRSGDDSVLGKVAEVLSTSVDEATALLREVD